MHCQFILVELVGDVALIRLNDEKNLNAMSPEMVDELIDALSQASRSKRAIVLTGTGRTFCAGANLGSLTCAAHEIGRPRTGLGGRSGKLLACTRGRLRQAPRPFCRKLITIRRPAFHNA